MVWMFRNPYASAKRSRVRPPCSRETSWKSAFRSVLSCRGRVQGTSTLKSSRAAVLKMYCRYPPAQLPGMKQLQQWITVPLPISFQIAAKAACEWLPPEFNEYKERKVAQCIVVLRPSRLLSWQPPGCKNAPWSYSFGQGSCCGGQKCSRPRPAPASQ